MSITDSLPRELREKLERQAAAQKVVTPMPVVPIDPEIAAKYDERTEKALHVLICQELFRREIPYIHARMDKRSPLPVGWPDFSVFLKTRAFFVEVKTATGRLSKEQERCIVKLQDRGYYVCVVRSFEEFKKQLSEAGGN